MLKPLPAVLLVAAVVLLVVGLAWEVRVPPKHRSSPERGKVLHGLRTVEAAAQELYRHQGTYPRTLAEIPESILAAAARRDRWGGEYVLSLAYTLLGPRVQVRSLGADGSESGDDIVRGVPGAPRVPAFVVPAGPSARDDAMLSLAKDAAARGHHFYHVRIPEVVRPFERGDRYRELLDGTLELAALGEVIGGGLQPAGGEEPAYRGIDVEVNDRREGLRLLLDVMSALGAPPGTVVEEYLPERLDYPVHAPWR